MKSHFENRYTSGPEEVKRMGTEELRKNFLIERIFEANTVCMTLTHYDRFIAGGAMPVTENLGLPCPDELKANYFLERRELGVINIGGKGTITADGVTYELDCKEALYIGQGKKDVQFSSADPDKPARYYFNSTPAHHAYAAKKIAGQDAAVVELGTATTANHRIINKLIVANVLPVCQLQVGMTELKTGSVWNTMPPHTHDRRMEVYFYFDLPEGQSVCHFMGQPQETRHIWVQNEQAVIVPNWSIHAGAGTSNYSFIWGMAGENLDYDDMDKCPVSELR